MKKIVTLFLSVLSTSSFAASGLNSPIGSKEYVCEGLTKVYESALQSNYYNDLTNNGAQKKAAILRMKVTAEKVCSPTFQPTLTSKGRIKVVYYPLAANFESNGLAYIDRSEYTTPESTDTIYNPNIESSFYYASIHQHEIVYAFNAYYPQSWHGADEFCHIKSPNTSVDYFICPGR